MQQDRYRVDELAKQAGISVDLVRSYQSRGLLPAPEHEGRHAWYGPKHLDRLREIRSLKDKGWSMRAIAETLAGPARKLAAVVDVAVDGADDAAYDRAGLASATGVPAPVLRSFEASGVLRPRHDAAGRAQYGNADVAAMKALLSLIGSGVPMEEFMAVAGLQIETVDKVAAGTFELFLRYLRAPLLARSLPAPVEAERMATALRVLLEAVGSLLAYNFQRTIFDVAQRYIAAEGTEEEQAALARTNVR